MSWVSQSPSVGLSRAQRVLPDQPQAPSISSVEQMPPVACRVESDLLGDRDVPAEAYCGIHTLRARENFRITGIAILTYPDFVNALAAVKQTAATANRELGLLPGDKAAAILRACEDVRSGQLHDQFVVDVIQGGAGTSASMNANEVIASRGLEHLGHGRGDHAFVHPLDDVNMGQSTNDVYPTAVKVGRTQPQDAVPMTLGRELMASAVMIGEDERRLAEAAVSSKRGTWAAPPSARGPTPRPATASRPAGTSTR